MQAHTIAAMTLALLLAACGGGGGGGDSASTTADANSQAAAGSSTTATTTPPPASSNGRAPAADSRYEREPLIESCDPGILKTSEKQLALGTLNEMRAAHGLPPVTYDTAGDLYTRQAALIGLVNRTLSHQPTPQWRCFSGDALIGAQTSNLYLRWGLGETNFSSPSTLASLLIDEGVVGLGHRRWMLSPFLATTSFGRVDGFPGDPYTRYTSVALQVTGSVAIADDDTPAARRRFIAYPDGDYPATWWKHGAPMSFSVFASTASASANDARTVRFADAVVTVRDERGQALEITDRAEDYTAYGLPNLLSWRAAGTVTGMRYTVSITNVQVLGVRRDYVYTFRITP